jgi:transcriptional regulator with XRE-family HTH domain
MMDQIQSRFCRNLTVLREHYNLTQSELAQILGSTQKNISAYERQRAFPKPDTMAALLDHFNVSYEMLTQTELSELPSDKLEAALHPAAAEPNSMPILVVDPSGEEKVAFVDQKAQAGYPTGIADQEFFETLPTFSLPFLGPGTFRAFEITGFSMMPLKPGTIVIGKYNERISDVKDGSAYLLVMPDGIVFKRLYHQIDEQGDEAFLCVSDNPEYAPFTVKKDANSILEVWQAYRLLTTME